MTFVAAVILPLYPIRGEINVYGSTNSTHIQVTSLRILCDINLILSDILFVIFHGKLFFASLSMWAG